MTRLDTRKCFGRYDGAALDYRDDGGNDEDEDDEDGYDDDVCRLSLPTTSLGWPHQLLKLIGAGPQEAAVVLLLMMMNAMLMMTMMIYVDCQSQHQRQLL